MNVESTIRRFERYTFQDQTRETHRPPQGHLRTRSCQFVTLLNFLSLFFSRNGKSITDQSRAYILIWPVLNGLYFGAVARTRAALHQIRVTFSLESTLTKIEPTNVHVPIKLAATLSSNRDMRHQAYRNRASSRP